MLGFLSFPLHWVLLCFVLFCFLPSASTTAAFQQVRLLTCLASASRGPSQIVSARLNLRNGTIYVKGVCNFLGSVSPQQKFEATDASVLLPCVIAQFYLESKGKYILEAWGQVDPKDSERRETPKPPAQFWLLFSYVFLLPLSLPYVNWAGVLFYLRSSLWSSDLPLFYFLGLSPRK